MKFPTVDLDRYARIYFSSPCIERIESLREQARRFSATELPASYHEAEAHWADHVWRAHCHDPKFSSSSPFAGGAVHRATNGMYALTARGVTRINHAGDASLYDQQEAGKKCPADVIESLQECFLRGILREQEHINRQPQYSADGNILGDE